MSIIKIVLMRDVTYIFVKDSLHFDHYYICLFTEMILVAICFGLVTYLFYRISTLAHKSYGRYIKSAFDIYRIDLSKRAGIPIPLCPNKEERNIWIEYGKFLEDYKELRQYEFRKKIK